MARKELSLKKAASLNLLAKLATLLVQFGITMALARLVLPSEYGVINKIVVVLGFLALFSDSGLGISVIQHPEMEKKDIEKLFSFSLLVGLILALAMVCLSYPMSLVYDNKIYLRLCPIASISAFFCGANAIPNAVLVRDKRFDLIALRTVVCAFLPGAIAVLLAYFKFGVYALLIQSIASTLLLFFWNYVKSPLMIKKFTFKEIRSLLGKYSLFQFSFSILNYFTRNVDNIAIGLKFGDEQLGHYDKAYTLNLYPNTLFTSAITSALHPYIRQYKNDFTLLYSKLVQLLKLLSWTGLFVMIVCFWGSHEIIMILFGEQWVTAVPFFKALSLCIWAQMLSSVAGSVFLGIEKTNLTFVCGVINLVLLILSVLVGTLCNSVLILSVCVSCAYNAIFFITYFILIKRGMNLPFFRFLKHFFPEILSGSVFVAVAYFLPWPIENVWLSILAKAGICSLFFLIHLLAFGQFSKFFETVKMVIHR